MIYTKKPNIPEPKIYFDAANIKHQKLYAAFLKNDRWREGCPFVLEFPFCDVPTMINHKITVRALAKYIE